jgi:regulator of PEP synthase PpsR (kinase-PPPase family)
MNHENNKKGNRRYIFIVSDATGKTCLRVVYAALRQFKTTEAVMETVSFVRTMDQIDTLIDRVAGVDGIVVYTMVSPETRQRINDQGRLKGVPTVDLLGPLLTRFSDLLEISPLARPGLGRQLDEDYFRRIEAVDYTIKHDDSLGLSTLGEAEIVLLGVSRTSKTPVSIYLSYRGWKVSNIAVVPDQPLPAELAKIDKRKIIALSVSPTRLQIIRLERRRKFKDAELNSYTDSNRIRTELNYGLELYRRHGYPVLDVTYKSIEETATEVMRLVSAQTGAQKGTIF